jgi:hypothetical protein
MERKLIEKKATELFGSVEWNEAQIHRATLEVRSEMKTARAAAEHTAYLNKLANWVD